MEEEEADREAAKVFEAATAVPEPEGEDDAATAVPCASGFEGDPQSCLAPICARFPIRHACHPGTTLPFSARQPAG